MHTLTRHYKQLSEKLESSVRNLTATILILEAKLRRPPPAGLPAASHTLPDGSSVTGYQLDDGSIVDQSGNELVDASGNITPGSQTANAAPTATNPAVPPTPTAGGTPGGALGAPITPSTVLSPTISPTASTASTPKTPYTVSSGLDVDYGRFSVKNDPRRDSALTRIGVGEVGKALIDARLQANLEMKDLESKRRSAGLTPEEIARLDALKTRWTTGYKGAAERKSEGEFNTRQREREKMKAEAQKKRDDAARIQTDQAEAQRNTAPTNVRSPRGELPPFVATGEPGSPGVAPMPEPQTSTQSDMVPQILNPDGTSRQSTQSGQLPPPPTQTKPPAPVMLQTTTPPPSTGGQVTTRAQSMSGTTPSQTSPTATPITKPGPGGMSTQPVGPMARPMPQPVQTTGMSVTAPTKPTTPEPSTSLPTSTPGGPKTALAASINAEQQGPGPAEKDRGIPSPTENPYANRQRGRVVTRAAATMSPRVRSSIRFA